MSYQTILGYVQPGQTYDATKDGANAGGIDPAALKEAYLGGDYKAVNTMIGRAGMSEAGASNVLGNMGYDASALQEMKKNGIAFAPSGTAQENTGWNTNATGPGAGTPRAGAPAASTTTTTGGLPAGTIDHANAAQIGAPTAWKVTPDQTVEGRINSIINGAVGQQARSGAVGQMNERGLSNSTMAITAGDSAAYQAAIPIATADAATAAKAAGYSVDQINQANTNNAMLQNQTGIANLNANTSWASANLSARTSLATAQLGADSQKAIATLNASTQTGMNQLDNQTKLQAQTLANQNQVLLNTSAQAASAFNQAVVSATNIQASTTLDAAAKTQAIAQIWESMHSQLTVLSQLNGLDLTSSLNFAGQPGYDAQGKWVGFGSSPVAAPTPAPIVSPDLSPAGR